ncbi:hypothetical protein [Alicyclobacillus acidiphilus]|uniref:hypothetical protein n=1 Tax=Alicyclobacillus acidiphilus TaxID=182455 RepID=UPI0008316F60|nr:hypothetical protein [Alicyclobacillus acidiphilus]
MENPRRRSSKQDSRSGQIIDLRAYQRRRNRKTDRQGPARFHFRDPVWLRVICYVLAALTVVLAVWGMLPGAAGPRLLAGALFSGTIGLVAGLVAYVLHHRSAVKLLLTLACTFVFAYICSIVHGIVY